MIALFGLRGAPHGYTMKSVRIGGTENYAEEAPELLKRYESVLFADHHRSVIHLIPTVPGRVLDIGAGTGRDAAGLVGLGHSVVAVEPTEELRRGAMVLHPSAMIEWVDDSLPDLAAVRARREEFDAVMLTAVWMHLDAPQRRQAMPNVAALVRNGGVMIMSLRHGPVPPGRRMFEVSAEETIALAGAGSPMRVKSSGRAVIAATRRQLDASGIPEGAAVIKYNSRRIRNRG